MKDFYDWLLSRIKDDQPAQSVMIGLVWTLCRSTKGSGLAMSPQEYSRNLEWSRPLAATPLTELAAGIKSWDAHQATVAMAAINAAIGSDLSAFEKPLRLPNGGGNLAVFDYFLPRIKEQNNNARIVVVGRYPGLERYEQEYELKVLERHPGPVDYPDTAAEQLIPQADWVFLTASSIINKTFPRLAELGRDAMLVLMGPTTPWLPGLEAWGIDFLAGVEVNDEELLAQTIAEGGGRTIFDKALSYVVADIGRARMERVKAEISDLAKQRDTLKQQMEQWYGSGQTRRFDALDELEAVQASLSRLDTVYKRMWDFRGN